MSDELELVERCLAGIPGAMRELIERFEMPVFAVCLKMLRHRQDAEDIAQDSLVRVCRHLAKFDRSRPLLPWVLAIAANRCRTELTKRSNRPASSEETPPRAAPPQADPTLADDIDNAFGELRPEVRECVILFYQQDLSIAEISEMTGNPVGTIKTWLHRGRNQLAEILKRRGYD